MFHTLRKRHFGGPVDELGVTPYQLRNIVVAGFKGSFFPGPYRDKRTYVRQVINRYHALAAELGQD